MWSGIYRDDLTCEFVRAIFCYDREAGCLRWRYRSDRARNWNTRHAGKAAGYRNKRSGHIAIRIAGHLYLAHRVSWLHVYGEWPSEDLDHQHRDGGDNHIEGLRLAEDAQNLWNRPKQANNTSGFKGVNFDKQTGKWRAKIKVRGLFHDLGRHATAELAAAAYAAAAERLHGEFACL